MIISSIVKSVLIYRFVNSEEKIYQFVNLMFEESEERKSIQLQTESYNFHQLSIKLKSHQNQPRTKTRNFQEG